MGQTTKSEAYAFEPFSSLDGLLRGEPFKILPQGTFYREDRKIDLTPERLGNIAQNVKAGLPRFRVPINTDHKQDAGKIGTVHDVEYMPQGKDGPGLYATRYEFSDKGKKLVTEDGYDAPSAELMWTLNGSKYQDPQTGKYHDNVLVGVAVTPRPYFGHANVALYSATMPDNFQLEGEPKTRHTLASVMGMLRNVMTALQAAKATDPDMDGDDDSAAQLVNALPVDKPEGANSAPVDPVPPVVEKGKPVDMTDAGVMKNQLPRELQSALQTDNHAALPPMVKCPECGQPMPKGTKCPKCGYQDKGEKPTEKMSGARGADMFRDYDAETRQAMAKKGEALPNGSYPIANAADLQNAISAIGRGGTSTALIKAHITKRAKALGLTDRLPADWEGSTKEKEAMSETTSPEPFAVQPDEFAALKAKADQFDALKAQVDTYAAELAKEKRARRIDVLRARYDGFSVPLEGQKTAELMHDLEAAAPELFGKIDALLETLDTQVKQAGLFAQISSARPGSAPDTFDAAVQKVLKDKFNGDMTKFSDAAGIVAKEQPDLYAEYRNDYSPNRGK